MGKGVAGILAVVLLIAIIFLASVTLFYWLAGQITTQPVSNTPMPIVGNVLSASAGYIEVAIANLGSQPLPQGNSFVVAENMAETVITQKIKPGEQRVFWFWGRYDKNDGYMGFDDRATIYDPEAGTSAPTLGIPAVETREVTAYEVFSTEGFEPSMSVTEDNSGVLWLVFTSNESIGSHDIWIMNSTDNGGNWNNPYAIAVQGVMEQEDSPQIAYNGTYYVLYRSWYGDNNMTLTYSTSAEEGTWSTPEKSNIPVTDVDPNEYGYSPTNKRGFAFILDDNNLFWASYIDGTDVVVRNSTDALGWNTEIVVNDSASPGKVSMMQDRNGKYWVAYVGADNTTIEVASSDDANTWGQPAVVSDEDYSHACTGPALMQDNHDSYFLFADNSGCTEIFVKASRDGVLWSRASWLPNATMSDRHPSVMQASDESYLMAFADADSIHVRTSSDPMIWVER
ncbi:sialidase family protein [archaeon]